MIPQWLADASTTIAVGVIILLIVKTLGWRKEKETLRSQIQDQGSPRTGACIQSPQIQTIMTNQALSMAATKRTEDLVQRLTESGIETQKTLVQLTRTTRVLALCVAKKAGTQILTGEEDTILPGG